MLQCQFPILMLWVSDLFLVMVFSIKNKQTNFNISQSLIPKRQAISNSSINPSEIGIITEFLLDLMNDGKKLRSIQTLRSLIRWLGFLILCLHKQGNLMGRTTASTVSVCKRVFGIWSTRSMEVEKDFIRKKTSTIWSLNTRKNRKKSKKATDTAWNYDQTTVDTLVNNFSLGLYYHFTIYEGKKVFTVWNADRSKLLRYVELNDVLKEEKKNKNLIPRPLALTYFRPRRNDPFGESFCDLLEDKEKAKSILANLSVIKAQKEARGGRFVVNSRLISNKEAVLNSSPYESFIFTTQDTEDENIANAMYELPQSQIKSDVFSMIQFVENEAKNSTAQDDLQKGIIPDKTMTKAEAQQAQANNNIRSLLKNTVASRWEKDFWFLRWRCYCEYFAQSDKKFVVLNNNFEYSGEEFVKDDFITGLDPHIMIGTRSELDSVDDQQAQFFTVQVLPMLQNPMIPETSKKMMIRHWFRLNKMKPNQIYSFMPLDSTERLCKSYVEMVNSGVMPEGIFDNEAVDYQTLRIFIQNAKNGELKEAIIGALSQILIQTGMMGMTEQYSQVANSASNIALSQGMQGMSQGLQTRQDVLPVKE